MAKLFKGETNTKSDVQVKIIGEDIVIDEIQIPLSDVNIIFFSNNEISFYYKDYTLSIYKDDLCFQDLHKKLSVTKRNVLLIAASGICILLLILGIILASTDNIANSIPDEYFSQVINENDLDRLFEKSLCKISPKNSNLIMDSFKTPEKFKFYIMNTSMKNAFAYPPDKIVFTSALLKELNDKEFFAILGHEIGHLHFKHYKPSVLRALVLEFFGMGMSSQFLKYFGGLLSVKHSRDAERESDEFAANLMIQNGLNLSHNISAMEKISDDAVESKYLSFISTHPATAERIKYFRVRIRSEVEDKSNNSRELVAHLLKSCTK